MKYEKLTYDFLDNLFEKLKNQKLDKPVTYYWFCKEEDRWISSQERHSPQVYAELERQLKNAV